MPTTKEETERKAEGAKSFLVTLGQIDDGGFAGEWRTVAMRSRQGLAKAVA